MTLALLIEYDGTKFAGWQIQPNGRTVQGELSSALLKILRKPIQVHGAGRTDAGVHGRGMVAHIRLIDELPMDIGRFLIALNATTGFDVVVRDIRVVPDEFHARHRALAREYRYTIKQERTAIERNFVWAISRPIDCMKMTAVTELLSGEHDFTSFSKRTKDVEHYRCIVDHASWDFHGTTFVLTIRANRFVRGMVRALVGAIVQVGQGAFSVEEFRGQLICPTETARAKYIAPAHGLVLEGIEYPAEYGLWHIGESPKRLFDV